MSPAKEKTDFQLCAQPLFFQNEYCELSHTPQLSFIMEVTQF